MQEYAMQIQWYPGHMHKASEEMKKILPRVDVVIELIDARIPFSSENPMLAQLRGDKPCIKILNKSDLADPSETAVWREYMDKQKGIKTLSLGLEKSDKALQITELCRKMVPEKSAGLKDIMAMIVGIPNVGKSTLINSLSGTTIAKTGNEPAITKGQQRINLRNGIQLYDTPGVLWPNVENKNSGYRLATTGAVKDTAMDYTDVAYYAAELLRKRYPHYLERRYQLSQLPDDPVQILDHIAKLRGCIGAGSQTDFDKVSKLFINEIRNNTLGRITLETPSDMQTELAELEIIRTLKAEKEAVNKKRRKR